MPDSLDHSVSHRDISVSGWRARPIVLVGIMGAGKTTIGKRFAKHIAWHFIDSDEEIEKAAGCSISDIFSVYGEAIFRDLEKRVLERLLREKPAVIATGGGAWMQPELRALIKQHACSIWLKADLEVLVTRVSRRNTRPLLEQGDKRAIMKKLMAERYPHYEQADITVNSSNGPHEKVVDAMVQALEAHGVSS
jgi:shikimate kinase